MRTEEEVRAANKKLFKRIGIGLLAIIVVIILLSTLGGGKDNVSKNQQKSLKPNLAKEVQKAINSYGSDTSALASTGVGGLQGNIVGIEPDGDNGVVVKVSTNYSDPGEDGGKFIAHTIYSAVCMDVPELETLYVTSTTSGLDSQSVYRSDVPACKKQ